MEIVGYEDYLIYDDGRVWSKIGKGRFLKPHVNNRDYLQVCLCNNGKRKFMRIHRLVALHYIENPKNKPEVDHWDNNKQNNNISNLRWATSSENQLNKRTYGSVPFKGVIKNGNKFVAQIRKNGKQKHIGTYDTAELASLAFNEYLIASMI